jgi:alanine dehydrogenase
MKNLLFIKVMYCIIASLTYKHDTSKTASLSISNIITPYLLQIADDGGIEVPRCDKGLKCGVYLYHGIDQ